jgi:hypothetical protein
MSGTRRSLYTPKHDAFAFVPVPPDSWHARGKTGAATTLMGIVVIFN